VSPAATQSVVQRLTGRTARPAWLVPGESSRRAGLAVIGIALFLGFGISYDNFWGGDNVLAIALTLSSIAIASVGAMALLTSGNVDLSIGSQFALISVLTAQAVKGSGSAVVGVIVALAVGTGLGLVNGILVRLLKIAPLIVTLGTLALYRGLASIVTNGVAVYGFPKSFTAIGTTHLLGIQVPVWIAGAVFALGSFVLLRTVVGLRLYAIGGNPDAARLTGINVPRTVVATYAVNGFLMGIVALLATARLSSGTPEIGVEFELDVLIAVILGGVAFAGGAGHPIGVLTGVVTIGILDSGLVFAGLQDWWQQFARGALLIAALASDQILVALKARRAKAAAQRGAGPGGAAAAAQNDAARPARHVGDVVLAGTDLSVRYGGVLALDSASLQVRAGEIVCLLGDNGAGKSTLIKVLSGAVGLDAGELVLDGRPLALGSPRDARDHGIETVFQDLALCPNLGIAHNLVLGDEPRRARGRWLGPLALRDDVRAAELADERLASLGVRVADVNRPVAGLSGGQRQAVAIARVLRDDVRVVILDEPTAALGVTQTRQVLDLVRNTAARGHGVILITHDVQQVFEIADRVVVLRLGRIIHDGPVAELDALGLLGLMSGTAPAEALR
jgi:ribose/xylose/arabinose/galactoside ABC-type transport system permease subunit/ABC-type branched-subunit amino acid transport system ATPase component